LYIIVGRKATAARQTTGKNHSTAARQKTEGKMNRKYGNIDTDDLALEVVSLLCHAPKNHPSHMQCMQQAEGRIAELQHRGHSMVEILSMLSEALAIYTEVKVK